MISLASSSLHPLATITTKPIGWGVIVAAAALGLIAAVAGLRVWRGNPINPRNSRAAEDKLRVLTVTLLPDSVIFLCWALIGLVSQIGTRTSGVAAAILVVVEIALGVTSLVAFVTAASLFFSFRPKRFVPPHLRERS
jgi:magnesium-transporting ATPase (P-type)